MKYEFKKFVFNKRNMGVFGFLIFFIICFIAYNVYMDFHYNESQIKIYQKAHQVSENMMNSLNDNEEYTFWKGVNRNSYTIIQAYFKEENTTEEFMKLKITWDELMIQANENGYVVKEFETRNAQTILNEIKQLKYLKKNNMQVLHSPYAPQTFNVWNKFFGQKIYLIVLLVVCILLCDIFGLEIESGFYKYLYVSRLSKLKIISNKIMFSVMIAFASIAVVILILLLSGLIFGFGNSEYPYFYFSQMYMVKDIVLQSLMLMMVESVFLVGISSLWFSVSLNTGFVLTMNLFLYALFYVFEGVINYQSFFVYVPFLHIDFLNMIIHKQVVFSIVVSFTYFMVCWIVSLNHFKKRELVR